MKYWVIGIVAFLILIGFNLGMDATTQEDISEATFAGGCFWCMEAAFQLNPGVTDVISGYSGGDEKNPTYQQVSSGKTSHREAINITYNPNEISYGKLLDIFWKSIDPTDEEGQFSDKGFQYKTAIFYHDEAQKEKAEKSKKMVEDSRKFDKPIVTEILPFTNFYQAEEYHQDYFQKQTKQYQAYAEGSGRKGFLKETWGEQKTDYEKPSEEDLKKSLTSWQYYITQKQGTEKPFENEFWDNKEEGIYVDIVSGEPLFSSNDKYDSRTGWPSFTKPLDDKNLLEKEDLSLKGAPRTELVSKEGNSHLGHVFPDGPGKEKGGTGERFCINSAALKFIPKEDLEKEGYGGYLKDFE